MTKSSRMVIEPRSMVVIQYGKTSYGNSGYGRSASDLIRRSALCCPVLPETDRGIDMTEYDRSYMLFLAGMIINCCWNNPWGALAGGLATFIGFGGMILFDKKAESDQQGT